MIEVKEVKVKLNTVPDWISKEELSETGIYIVSAKGDQIKFLDKWYYILPAYPPKNYTGEYWFNYHRIINEKTHYAKIFIKTTTT